MTSGEIASWGGVAVVVIGAIGTQIANIIITLREAKFARKREYAIHDAVKDTHQAVVDVHKEATNAYNEANHVNVKIADLSKRLIEQGKLAEQASEVLPHVQATTDETNELTKEIHDKLP